MENELMVRYFYDSILGRNVYGVPPQEEELAILELIANNYKKLSSTGREYIKVRLDMIGEEE